MLLFIVIGAIAKSETSPPHLSMSGGSAGDLDHQIDVLIGHINFINAWSLGVLGALCALGVKLLDMGRWTFATRQVLFIGFGLEAASLYAGHECRLSIVNAYLGAGFVDYRSAFVVTMTWLQAGGLLAGCVTFPVILGLQACQQPPPVEEAESP